MFITLKRQQIKIQIPEQNNTYGIPDSQVPASLLKLIQDLHVEIELHYTVDTTTHTLGFVSNDEKLKIIPHFRCGRFPQL